MDLYSEMLLEYLRRENHTLSVEMFRLRLKKRVGILTRSNDSISDRLIGRHVDYPRALRRIGGGADLYHVIDQSYAASINVLSRTPTVVTCHDLDAFSPLTLRNSSAASILLGPLAKRTLRGLTAATHVVCVSCSVQRDLVARGWQAEERTSVIPNGVDPHCSPVPSPLADCAVGELLPFDSPPVLMHVGSTIQRKRIDILLEAFKMVSRQRPGARLIKAGGAFTAKQKETIERLGLDSSITVLPFMDRPTIAAFYRRADIVLLPSEREGFGLPIIEAMACGTPVLASDIEVLREVGGSAASYAPCGKAQDWGTAILCLLDERDNHAERWSRRIQLGLTHARQYSWADHARRLAQLYHTLINQ